MKKIIIITLSVILVSALIFGALPAMAAKPVDKNDIPIGNGFPSGMHFNLNIHGKTDFNCNTLEPDPITGYFGNSVFIPEYGQSSIFYEISKRSTITELQVEDPCAFDNDGSVKVLLPYKVWDGEQLVSANGFWVYARIKAKPNNNQDDSPSKIVVSQNMVRQVTQLDEDLIPIGYLYGSDVYLPNSDTETFERFEPGKTTAKGKNKAVEITELFKWSGWLCDTSLDIDGPEGIPDGYINDYDVPSNAYDVIDYYYTILAIAGVGSPTYYDSNYGGAIDSLINEIEEWLAFMADLWAASQITPLPEIRDFDEYPVSCEYYTDEYIWDLAEIFGEVLSEQPIDNYGTKLLQVRFYPKATTIIGDSHPNK